MKRIRNLGSVIIDELRLDFVKKAFRSVGSIERLLDLGCGLKPFQDIYKHCVNYSIGMDVPTTPHGKSCIDVGAIGTKLPFKNETFDIVICTEVMEHVAEPKQLLYEARRVLRPNGILIVTTPFLVPVHESPYDFYRYTNHGLEYLIKQSELHLVEILPFSELFGVIISFFVQAQLKLWYIASKKTNVPLLYSIINPFILFTVYLPQIIYVFCLRRSRRISVVDRVLHKLSYTAKGYGLIARK